jgi:hypothetical protein
MTNNNVMNNNFWNSKKIAEIDGDNDKFLQKILDLDSLSYANSILHKTENQDLFNDHKNVGK